MFSKFELIGFGVSALVMALALYLLTVDTALRTTVAVPATEQPAAGIVAVTNGEESRDQARANALSSATNRLTGEITQLVMDDIVIGTGDRVVAQGDTVTVHYIGTLQTGQEFDNSNRRGTPFTFTVGEGRVIAGWEQGIVGMKEGGQRILVIPSDLAYGPNGYGPIPGNATLVFAIELLAIAE